MEATGFHYILQVVAGVSMRKVIKIFLSVFSWLVLAAIIIPLCLALMLYLPPVQNFAVRQAANVVGNRVGTEVSVEKVRVKFFSRLALDGVYIEDARKDTLFYVRELNVGIATVPGLLRKDLALGRVGLVQPKFYLHQQADSISNLKHLILAARGDAERRAKGGKFKMRAAALEIEDMRFVYTKYVKVPREGVNFTDIATELKHLDVENISVDGDSITMRVKDIALRDKSGFAVERLSSEFFSVSPSGLRFRGVELDASGSHVEMDLLNMLYTKWQMADFLEDVRFESKMDNSTVDFRTIAYFAPSLNSWDMTVGGVEALVEGPVADMKGRVNNALVHDSRLAASFVMTGLPDVNATRFEFQVDDLQTQADDARRILATVSKNIVLGDNVYAKLRELGKMSLTGSFSGLLGDFVSQASLRTDRGNADFNLKLRPRGNNGTAFAGKLSARDFRAGQFLNVKELDRASFTAAVDGFWAKERLEVRTDALISDIGYKGYRYKGVRLDGTIKNKLFQGKISSPDPNLDFDFDGMLDFNAAVPQYDFAMELRGADLARLNLNPRDSVSVLKCRMSASGSGKTLDDLNGRVQVTDLTYVANADTLTTAVMTLEGRNSEESKNVELRSDFADIDFRSRTSYKELFPQIRNMLRAYMPMLAPKSDGRPVAAINAPSDASNYSILKVDVKETDNLAGVLLPGLVVAKGSKLSLLFNPYIRKFSLSATSEYLEYKNNFASDIEVNSRDEGDSLTLYLRAGDLYAKGLYMPQFSVNAGVKDNAVNAATHFANSENGMSALIGMNARLGRDSLDGRAQVSVRLTPSSFSSNGQTWNIFARNIVFGSRKAVFNNLVIMGSGQALYVNGPLTENKEDTLKVRLVNFDIAPISQLTSKMGYNITGKMNGTVGMASAMNGGMLEANVEFDSVVVNKTRVPATVFASLWDFENERARFTLTPKGTDKPAIRGYYRPAEKSYMAFLEMKDIDMSLLEPFLKGSVSDIRGTANASVEFSGEGRSLKTNGVIGVPELTTTVDYLNVPYTVRGAEVKMVNNKLSVQQARFTDPEGNEGLLDVSVNLNNLKNIDFSVSARPNNMLVLDTSENDNDMFFGRVYGSGRARITGDKRGVNINVNATTANRSEFHLPLSGKADALRSDLVVFKKPDKVYADSSDYLVRKRMIVNRNSKLKPQSESSSININMVLNVLPNALVELVIDPKMGGAMRGRGNGSVTLNINPSSNTLNMYGDYRITEGVYTLALQDIIERNFTIADGSSIQWTGDPVDALLNISAVYKLKTSLAPLLDDAQYSGTVPVECWLTMSERLSAPLMTFNILLPNSEAGTQMLVANSLNTQEMMATQFFSLIAFRKFYRDMGQGLNIGSASPGTDELVNILSSQLTNWLSNDRFNIGLTYRSQSEYNSDEVNLDFSTSLAGNRLLLEAEGNYDAQNTPNLNNANASNITGDFALTWLMDKNGNLRLKGFTRTIDRFDENQGLQESGIGVYYREDFNNLNELLRNIKYRFSIFGRKKDAPVKEGDEAGGQKATDAEPEEVSEKITVRPDMQKIEADSLSLQNN